MSANDRSTAAPRASDELLVCTVRGCGEGLILDERRFTCPRGHAYDLAREGYVNLLQPTDRRSLAAGDTPESIAARARLHERGLLDHVTKAIVTALLESTPDADAALADLGCGSGHVLRACAESQRPRAVGLDLSSHAARTAARTAPAARIAVANVDRNLPIASDSLAAVLSIFGPKPVVECARILAPRGTLILCVPAADDLIELRELATGERRLEDRAAAATALFAPTFEQVAHHTATAQHHLDAAGLSDLAAASYRAARHAERRRLADVAELTVTMSADVLVLRKR